jgi:glutamate racemase
VAGPGIRLIDSAEAMADITANLLAEGGLENPKRRLPDYRFFVTDVPHRFQAIGEHILGRTLSHVEIVKW